MADYDIRLLKDDGTYLATLRQAIKFEYLVAPRQIGTCELTLPPEYADVLLPDYRIEIWRRLPMQAWGVQRVYTIRGPLDDGISSNGVRTIVTTGVDFNALVWDRIVAYRANESYSKKTDAIDDIMRAAVRENMGALCTDTDRMLPSGFLTVEADKHAGPVLTDFEMYNESLGSVFSRLTKAAKVAGTELYWDMTPQANGTVLFRVVKDLLGIDRTFPAGNPSVELSMERRSLAEPHWVREWQDETTIAYVGGSGAEATRVIQTCADDARLKRSWFSRREKWFDAADQSDAAGLLPIARAAVEAGRPRQRFTASYVDTPNCAYGVHVNVGDKVMASYCGQTFVVTMAAASIAVDEQGKETITVGLEYSDDPTTYTETTP